MSKTAIMTSIVEYDREECVKSGKKWEELGVDMIIIRTVDSTAMLCAGKVWVCVPSDMIPVANTVMISAMVSVS